MHSTHPLVSSVVTGVIRTCWHIPYYVNFLSPAVRHKQTSLSVPVLILLAFIMLPLEAFAHGELRLLSKTVWTAWLLHTVMNAFSFTLVTGGFMILSKGAPSILLAPGTEGIVYSVLRGLIGWGLHQYRMQSARAVPIFRSTNALNTIQK